MSARRRSWIGLGLLLLVGVIVYLPSLRSSFLLDDYLHASMVNGTFPVPRSPFDLYNFVDDGNRSILIDRGMLPWWSHPRLTIRFFRPLSSALLWADHRLLGTGPLPLHLHSLLWWVALVLAARALFRRLLPPRAARLATVIFALAPAHALPLAWLANREALISLTFGILAFGAYLRWREGRGLQDGAAATALFALSLLGGEYALCLGGYVLAFEIATRGESPFRRGAGALPFAVPAAAYLIVRAALRFGTAGSGFYSDPFRESAVFLRRAPQRFVVLLADAWLSLDANTLGIETPAWVLVLFVVAAGALLFVPLRRTLGHLDDARRKTATWMLLGSFFALAPVLAVVPSPRLLGASLFGISGVVALILDHAWFPAASSDEGAAPARRGEAEITGLMALLLGFLHLVHGPATSWLVGRFFQKSAAEFSDHAATVRGRIADPASANVVVVRGMGGSFFLPFALDERGSTLPTRWRILAQVGHALALRRGPRTLDIVVPRDQSVFPSGEGYLFRNERVKLAAGDALRLPGVQITIVEVGSAGPRSVRFEFESDLEDPELLWIDEQLDGFHDVALPQIGFGKPFDPQ